MKKLIFSGLAVAALIAPAAAQRSPRWAGAPDRSIGEAADRSDLAAFFGAPEFHMVITVVVVMAVSAWLFYTWLSFQLVSEGGAGDWWKGAGGRPEIKALPPHLSVQDGGVRRVDFTSRMPNLLAAGHETRSPEKTAAAPAQPRGGDGPAPAPPPEQESS